MPPWKADDIEEAIANIVEQSIVPFGFAITADSLGFCPRLGVNEDGDVEITL